MWTLVFVVAIVFFWYVILPVWANYQTIKWNEQSRGQHRYLYRTRPTPKSECATFLKDCGCPTCSPRNEIPETRAEDQGPYR